MSKKVNVNKSVDEKLNTIIENDKNKNIAEVVDELIKEVDSEAIKIVEGITFLEGFLRIRKTPEILEDNVIGKLSSDSKVTVINPDVNKEFYQIKTEDGIEGWVMKNFIKLV